MLGQLGEGAKVLAGGQSLIPLLKLRFANPEHLVDLNFIPDTSFIKEDSGTLHFGAMTRHAEIEHSALERKVPTGRLRRHRKSKPARDTPLCAEPSCAKNKALNRRNEENRRG